MPVMLYGYCRAAFVGCLLHTFGSYLGITELQIMLLPKNENTDKKLLHQRGIIATVLSVGFVGIPLNSSVVI